MIGFKLFTAAALNALTLSGMPVLPAAQIKGAPVSLFSGGENPVGQGIVLPTAWNFAETEVIQQVGEMGFRISSSKVSHDGLSGKVLTTCHSLRVHRQIL